LSRRPLSLPAVAGESFGVALRRLILPLKERLPLSSTLNYLSRRSHTKADQPKNYQLYLVSVYGFPAVQAANKRQLVTTAQKITGRTKKYCQLKNVTTRKDTGKPPCQNGHRAR
jgi:hypothetical protein